jgi:hypothetical protein
MRGDVAKQRAWFCVPSFKRILRMLESEVIKAGWVNGVAAPAPAAQEGGAQTGPPLIARRC